MVKWLILAAILLIAFPVVAGASTSRIMGMGTQGDYIKDYTNIFGYPSCVAGVGNLVYGEFGQVVDYDDVWGEYFTTEDRSVGAVLGNLFDGRFGTFAFHLREISPTLGSGHQALGYGGMSPEPSTSGATDTGYEYSYGVGFETYMNWIDPNAGYHTEAFDLMWGKKFNSLSLGLRLNRSAYKQTGESGGTDYSYEGYDDQYDRNILGFGGGVGFEFSPTLQGELGLLYQNRTYKWEYTDGDVDESDGGGTYLASGRMMWQCQPNLLVVPVARVYSFDYSSKYTPDGGDAVKYEVKFSGWQAGVAGNWTLNQNDLLVAGVTFATNTQDFTTADDKYTETIMPTLFASIETKVNSWLTLRFGGRKGVFYSVKYEDTDPELENPYEYKTSYSPFQFFTGAGVKLGTLQFDATLAQDFFHNPATYITAPVGEGYEGGGNYYSPLFPRVTATYTF